MNRWYVVHRYFREVPTPTYLDDVICVRVLADAAPGLGSLVSALDACGVYEEPRRRMVYEYARLYSPHRKVYRRCRLPEAVLMAAVESSRSVEEALLKISRFYPGVEVNRACLSKRIRALLQARS